MPLPHPDRLLQHRLSRRSAFTAGLGVVASLSLLASPASANQVATPSATPRGPELVTPPEVVASQDGVLRTTLTAMHAQVDMGAAKPDQTYIYDGIVPGRTWEVHPGDTLQFEVVNNLPVIQGDLGHHVDMTRPHQWTNTNIHTHGLHVSPAGNSDNVFIDIPPGESEAYRIEIPDDHTGGLFWYHPHRHGAVAQQVRGGMAGAIIVRGEIDTVEEVAAAREQVLLLQAIELGDDFQLLDPIPYPTIDQAFYPRTQILYTVNGRMNPTIRMYPGEVQRWRMLNAAEGKFMSLRLDDSPLHVLAWDGLTLHEPEPADDVMMSAGNRVDILVKAGKPGVYQLMLTPGSSQHPSIPGMSHATPTATESAELKTRSILTLEVIGSGPEMALPTALPAYDPPILPIARTRHMSYTVQREPDNSFISFGIDGMSFDPDRRPYQMKLGTAEEWTVKNDIDFRYPEHAHGFHVHVNPFRVIRINGEPVDRPMWRDTFALSGLDDDDFTFEMNLDDFTGRFVQHCHVLTHEDLGMMEALEVVP